MVTRRKASAAETPAADAHTDAPPAHVEAAQAVDDLGQAEVQARSDIETSRGVAGVKVDPIPDEEYTLATGPDSPSYFPDDRTRSAQHIYDNEVTDD